MHIDWLTLGIQAANFLIFLVLFNAILIKPMLRHLQDRDDKISGDHDQAKENSGRAQAMLEDYEHELADARSKASQTYMAAQEEGMLSQRDKLSAARVEAQDIMSKAMDEVVAEAEKASNALRAEVEQMQKDIASKLLGRAV